jgi:eukaryotic-like serine/threonine-protein kinase
MSPAATPPLSQLSRYELITQLGEGGMARVFLAISRGPIGFNKLMVVKQIRPELAADNEFLGMFLDEARIALALHHPNIVETYEIFEEDGRHLMAMEYLDGQTQADLLFRMGRDRMPLEEHIWILTQVLAALHHAHDLRAGGGQSLDIVHRDVSPSNVFITYDGRVKLLDFGIAKATGAISTTARGTVKAKIGYGAPEQFLSNPIDRRADIFSVGVMLWEALAGCRRKIGETRAAMIEARVSGLEPSIRAVRPGVPAALAAICDRATAVRPEARYETAAELGRELGRWLTTRTRVVGARDVGALMNRHFAAERQARRQSIERQLGGSDTDPTRSLVIPTTPVQPARRSTPTAPGPALNAMSAPPAAPAASAAPAARISAAMPSQMAEHAFSTLVAVELETPPPDPQRRGRVLLMIGSASAAVLGAALVLIFSGGPPPAPAPRKIVPARSVDLARQGRPALPAQPAPPTVPAMAGQAGRDLEGRDQPGRDNAVVPAGDPDRRDRPRTALRRSAGRDDPAAASLGAVATPSGTASSPAAPPGVRPAPSDVVPVSTRTAVTGGERPAARAIQPGEPLPRPSRSRRPRRQLDEEDPYR